MRSLLTAMGCFVIVCCNTNQSSNLSVKYPYAINDFPPALHVYLLRIINPGFIGDKNYDSIQEIDSLISDNDLLRLTLAEHPLLRSVALSIASDRASIDHYSLLMNHLDDTARVSWYFQCASWEYTYVSDYMIYRYEWATQQDKEETIKKILKEHNYLISAYDVLGRIEIDESHYSTIKKMAERDIPIFQRSNALLALASFGKAADSTLLANTMDQNNPYLDCNCFEIMKKNHSDHFFEILKRYARNFRRRSCDVDDYYYRETNSECFLEAVASYRNVESGKILRTIFKQSPFLPCSYSRDTSQLKEKLYTVIIKNECEAYRDMTGIIKPILEARKKDELPPFELEVELPDTKPRIWWR